MSAYLFNCLIGLDQLLNVLVFDGMPDETISARCWREQHQPFWYRLRLVVDYVFLRGFAVENHCQKAFVSEQRRLQMPASYRTGKLR
ncbi:MAG: hypothetical protein PHU14_05760 [Methylovulum sp.]|nr:hypothetical protein [Methylovulum sp.]